jgi:hypothetical protein
MRGIYHLPKAIFELEQIEQEPVARQIVKRKSAAGRNKENERIRYREAA